MSQENVELLRALYDQFGRGDFSASADLPDEFKLVLAREMPDAGTYRGEEARRWLRAWVDSFDRLTLEAIDFIDAGDQVVTEMVQRGQPAGGAGVVELRTWTVSTFRDRLPERWELFLSREEALEAAGLQE